MSEAASVAVALRQETSAVMLTNQQLQMIANTPFVPAAFRGKVPEILACVATGRALGLPDMTSLRGINVIDGKAAFSAELMDAIVRSHGHSISGTVDDTKAVVRGKRADNGDEMEATFTLEMAERAGLLGRPSWKKHPDDMMWARAVSKLCRRLFADCFAGATYVPEEVEVTADEVMDDPAPERLNEPSAPPPAAPSSPVAAGAASGASQDGDDQQAAGKPPHSVSAAAGFSPPLAALQQARDTVIPVGQQSGKTLAWMAEQGEKGDRWFLNALRSEDVTGEFRGSVELFVRAEKPEVWAEYQQAVLA